jgi:hypothetical protein
MSIHHAQWELERYLETLVQNERVDREKGNIDEAERRAPIIAGVRDGIALLRLSLIPKRPFGGHVPRIFCPRDSVWLCPRDGAVKLASGEKSEHRASIKAEVMAVTFAGDEVFYDLALYDYEDNGSYLWRTPLLRVPSDMVDPREPDTVVG